MQSTKRSFGVVLTLPRRPFSHPVRSFTTSQSNWSPLVSEQEPQKQKTKLSQRGKGHRSSWSPEEETLLLKLREDRLSWQETKTHFPSRSQSALVSKYWQIGPRGEHGRYLHTPRFTDAERALLIELRGEGIAWREIQRRHFPDHSWRQLSVCYVQTRPDGEGDSWTRREWSEEESRKLLKLREKGKMDWPELASEFKRSHASVKAKYAKLVAERLGRGDRIGYVRVKGKAFWPDEDEVKLVEMLKNGATQKDISEKWPRWGQWGLKVKIMKVKRKIGLLKPRKVSPIDMKSLAKMTSLKANGSSMKEIADLMPEFKLGELRYAYKKAQKRKKAAVGKHTTELLEEKE